MTAASRIQKRIENQTSLLYKFVYISSGLSILMCLICAFALNIRGVIPYAFLAHAVLNLGNILFFKKYGNLMIAGLTASGISLLITLIIILFSGGINSPFIFILAVIVLSGYISASVFGRIYLFVIISTILLIYGIDEANFSFISNEIPEKSEDLFSLISLLFAVYLMGGIFVKDILKAHHSMKKSKEEIENRIFEKETILREVHHRVKNNLQTVSSLLNLQAKNSTNKEIKDLANSSRNRVNSMAMIHEMLYMRDDLSKIEFRSYVKELTEYLLKSVDGRTNNVVINIDIPDVHLGIDTVIPLGLLINEAVTNSLKYGFADNGNGQIDICLKKEENGGYSLELRDNGKGFSKEIDFRTTKSLGLKLIHNLAIQLKGSVKRDFSQLGTYYNISFQDVDTHRSSIVK